MIATDYILRNDNNKTFPFGVEYYEKYNGVLSLEYIGFESISRAINFIEKTSKILYKQK